MTTSWDKYSDGAGSWTEDAYADAAGYLAARAQLVVSLGPRLEPGDVVLDLACGDGGLGDFLPEQRYRGVDASPEMVAAARARGRDVVQADLNDYEPERPVQATTVFRAIYYARDRRALFEESRGLYREEARLRSEPAAIPARRCPRRPARRRLRPARRASVLRAADARARGAGRPDAAPAGAERAAGAARAPRAVHLHVFRSARGGAVLTNV